jgi:RNAse (barnase) inhibitor barstar
MQKEVYRIKDHHAYTIQQEPVVQQPYQVFVPRYPQYDAILIKETDGQLLYYVNASGISTKEDFYRLLADILKFPKYFGKNLDAVYDCLCDLEWIASPYISLTFIDWKQALQREEITFRNQVLDLLRDVNQYWHKQPISKLHVTLQ